MPSTQRVTFPNAQGQSLAGALSLPDRRTPRAVALFAHCFTCGKANAAASRISRTLCANGFAVLRFDFTGLGGSEGDFGNTGFASNVEDLIAAADYLRTGVGAPDVLVGHSLGGTATLAAAGRIEEARAVVTIGAPATPDYVIRHLAIDDDSDADSYVVSIGGREFSVRNDFVERFSNDVGAQLGGLKRALLVMHAPLDDVVGIDQASRIFQMARHPKSFISLDGADHLLSRLEDAQYVAETITAWVMRYLPAPTDASKPAVSGGHVRVDEANRKFLRQVATDDHAWLADEPKSAGGDNLGPDPYEHLLAALGTCTSMTIRMYASRKSLPLEDVAVTLSHRREYASDCDNCDDTESRIDVIERTVDLRGDLDEAELERLLEIAERCPVHRTLQNEIRIDTRRGEG